MSVHTAKSQFSFQLPSLSYVDAKWEEPNLLGAPVPAKVPTGFATWLSRLASSMIAAWQRGEAKQDLANMSDCELRDIGLTRSDLHRVFMPEFSQDLRQRCV